jgi:hypothetical protein
MTRCTYVYTFVIKLEEVIDNDFEVMLKLFGHLLVGARKDYRYK